MNPHSTVSMSALMAAAARAAHALVDDPPHLVADPVAQALCCATPSPSPLDYQRTQPTAPLLAAARLSTVARSAFADERLVRSRIGQYVVLGAGLDTSAHRLRVSSPTVSVWLLDREGVLSWRSELFAAAGLADVGTSLACDLAQDSAVDQLLRHGLDLSRPAFVAWLGVSMYLAPNEVDGQFVDLARLAPGSRLVFDYVLPPRLRDESAQTYASAVSAATGSAGEPWRSTPAPEEISAMLDRAGWRTVEDVAESDAPGPGFWPRTDALRLMQLIRLRHAVVGG